MRENRGCDGGTTTIDGVLTYMAFPARLPID
jgi:hypothetical protein